MTSCVQLFKFINPSDHMMCMYVLCNVLWRSLDKKPRSLLWPGLDTQQMVPQLQPGRGTNTSDNSLQELAIPWKPLLLGKPWFLATVANGPSTSYIYRVRPWLTQFGQASHRIWQSSIMSSLMFMIFWQFSYLPTNKKEEKPSVILCSTLRSICINQYLIQF